ncbi:hypothetical protein TWF730_000892 [Orbilia blumenaviensis]|uniref:Uncharacterized protein n=1 Tax=Orbilia blumenaviensis TaxID=1796055 RepID=A0AAV9VR20_9PEZI
MQENVETGDFYRYMARSRQENSQHRPNHHSSTSPSENSEFDRCFGFAPATENTVQSTSSWYTRENSATTQSHYQLQSPDDEPFGSASITPRHENQISPCPYGSSQSENSENIISQIWPTNQSLGTVVGHSTSPVEDQRLLGSQESLASSSRSPSTYVETASSLLERSSSTPKTGTTPDQSYRTNEITYFQPQSKIVHPPSFQQTPKPGPLLSTVDVFTVGPGVKYQWNITTERCQKWEALHREWSGDLGVLVGDKAVQRFSSMGLQNEVLGQIWEFADTDNSGFLTQFQFQVAMHLIEACKQGHQHRVLENGDVVAELRRKLTKTPRPTGHTRAQYEEELLQELLPRPEEVTEQTKDTAWPVETPQAGRLGPDNSVRPSADRPVNPFGTLDDFDDNDLSDDQNIISYRMGYHRERVISFFKEGNYPEALMELEKCGYTTPFDFRAKVAKAILQNLDRSNEGNGAVAGVTIARTTYSSKDGVLANLMLYFTRALSRYYGGVDPEIALQDCKRGLKLANLANVQPQDRLAHFVKSDLADLAATIISISNNEVDTQFYRSMVEEDHETHHLIKAGPGRIELSPQENAKGQEFLSHYNVFMDLEMSFGPTPRDFFMAFDAALSEQNFAACFLITVLIGQSKVYRELRNGSKLQQHRDVYRRLSDVLVVYPPTLLHFIASYPQTKFGPSIAAELIKTGISVHSSLAISEPLLSQSNLSQPIYDLSLQLYTPLGFAVLFNNVPLMQTLIDLGASMEHIPGDISKSLEPIPSPLYLATCFAALIGSLDPLAYLLQERHAAIFKVTRQNLERRTTSIALFDRLAGGYTNNPGLLIGSNAVATMEAFELLLTHAKLDAVNLEPIHRHALAIIWRESISTFCELRQKLPPNALKTYDKIVEKLSTGIL